MVPQPLIPSRGMCEELSEWNVLWCSSWKTNDPKIFRLPLRKRENLYASATFRTSRDCRLASANPPAPDRDSDLRVMLNVLFSAEAGFPVRLGYQKLVEVGHYLDEQYPQHLLVFGYALKHFERDTLIEEEDASGKWRKRSRKLRQKLSDRVPKYLPDRKLLPILSFLFPEIGERVSLFLDRDSDN